MEVISPCLEDYKTIWHALFCKKYFYKQHQGEIWFGIIKIYGIKRGKEHYCYQIHTLLMKSSAYPPFYTHPQYGLPPPHF